jgi:hypothetical protein
VLVNSQKKRRALARKLYLKQDQTKTNPAHDSVLRVILPALAVVGVLAYKFILAPQHK